MERRRQMAENNHSIYEVVRHLEEAWNNNDSQRFASTFHEDADYITIFGLHYNGRELVDTNHRRIFASLYNESRSRFSIESVRFVRPDVVVVFTKAVLELKSGETISCRPTMLLTKDNRRWQIAVLQNTAVSDMCP
jgi:uncharacterized protein (TIGR02246 family)